MKVLDDWLENRMRKLTGQRKTWGFYFGWFLSITNIGDISGRIDLVAGGRAGWLVMQMWYEEHAELSFVYTEVEDLVEHPGRHLIWKNLGKILCVTFLLFPVVFSTEPLVSINTYLNE